MKNKNDIERKIVKFILISLILHIILLLFFILFAFKKPIIERFIQIDLKKEKKDDSPAALKPRKSEFGTTELFNEIAEFTPKQETIIPKNFNSNKKYKETEDKKSTKKSEKKSKKKGEKTQKTIKKVLKKIDKKSEELKPKHDKKKSKQTVLSKDLSVSTTKDKIKDKIDTTLIQTKNKRSNLLISLKKKHGTHGNASQDRSPRTKSIIGMTTGYIENLKQKGDSWIERKGDKNKKPSIEDLKYISYENSVQWQLQQSRNINFNRSKFLGNRRTTKILFTIDNDGNLYDIKIVQTSGNAELDNEWVKIITMAAPFPPIPKHFNMNYYTTGRECKYN